MQSKDVIRSAMGFSDQVFSTYLSDMSDQDLLTRPGDGCNHVAWQIGHLISSEVMLLEMICQGEGITLPDGFAETHSKENCDCDDGSNFHTLQQYQELYEKARKASRAALDSMPEERLDEESPEQMRSFCPTLTDMWVLIATHP
ncbi:MAG: DinB family protein, partial [Planctomycetota bacterium]